MDARRGVVWPQGGEERGAHPADEEHTQQDARAGAAARSLPTRPPATADANSAHARLQRSRFHEQAEQITELQVEQRQLSQQFALLLEHLGVDSTAAGGDASPPAKGGGGGGGGGRGGGSSSPSSSWGGDVAGDASTKARRAMMQRKARNAEQAASRASRVFDEPEELEA